MPRNIEMTTPLEKDVLLFHRMRGTEELGRLFEYNLDLLSTDGAVDLDQVLGNSITVTLQRPGEGVRHFNGFCSRISEGGREGRYYVYHATVRPWLWFLTRTRNYRIFQEKNVPDILKEIFNQHGISAVQDELTESYAPWTYCVQYNESDFAFVSRLMEHEGIYYYFRHAEDKHTLVLADSYSAHSAAYEDEIPFIPPHERVRADREHVREWSITRELQPGKYALTAYDFEKPSVDLQVRSTIKRKHALAEYEVFEYGGDYVDRGDGELYARTRIEEVQAKYERTRGVTDARAIAPGYLFKLASHPRADQNAEYLVVSAEYELQSAEYEARDTAVAEYTCRFIALNSQHPFRSERVTPKPIVQGPQTALVVGPAGEDIHTDKFGRVKVHFYWNRHDSRDENSSCWIRVSQNWGGKNWGGMFIPHVGQEVIVMFEEGDPDRPLITGRVYNAEQMPPLDLPANKTKSIIRDHGSNHIRMEGAAGKEQIHLSSPYANSKVSIGAPNDKPGISLLSDEQLTLRIGQNWDTQILGARLEIIQRDLQQQIDGKEDRKVAKDSKVFIGGDEERWCKGAFRAKWDGVSFLFHSGAVVDVFGGLKSENIFGIQASTGLSASLKKWYGAEFHRNHAAFRQRCTGDARIDSDATLTLIGGAGDASQVILSSGDAVIKSGSAEIVITKSGGIRITSPANIELDAKNIHLKADTKVTVNASSIDFLSTALDGGKKGTLFS